MNLKRLYDQPATQGRPGADTDPQRYLEQWNAGADEAANVRQVAEIYRGRESMDLETSIPSAEDIEAAGHIALMVQQEIGGYGDALDGDALRNAAEALLDRVNRSHVLAEPGDQAAAELFIDFALDCAEIATEHQGVDLEALAKVEMGVVPA